MKANEITEQSEVVVKFKIVELLHVYDQLITAHDASDEENAKVCDYLCDRILEQLPNFTESKDYYKQLI